MYKIRIILDTKEDVIRTIFVDNSINLEKLHFAIAKSFGFNGNEMASFYKTDHEWNQGEEIPFFDMAESGSGLSMANLSLLEALPEKESKLIYVYDFLNMWTFYVETVAIDTEKDSDLPKTVFSVGEIPKTAPEKEFVAETDDLDFKDDDDETDIFDGFDFEEY